MFFSLAILNNASILSTVLLAVTLSPTTPHVTPSGLKKSFCGSVITMAVFSFTVNPGSGNCANRLVTLVAVNTNTSANFFRVFNFKIMSY